jgi:hypothetical protein
LKVTQINGQLTMAWNDCRNWVAGNNPCSPSIHIFTADVSTFPVAYSGRDRVFGLRNIFDDNAADVVGYGMPGIVANQNNDIAVVYSRTSPLVNPEARYSTWFANEPDIRPSQVLQQGQTFFNCVAGPGVICPTFFQPDTGGASLDPFDLTGVWMAHLYINAGNSTSIAVGKVFGQRYPGLVVSNISQFQTTIHAGDQFPITFTVTNHGDGDSQAAYVRATLSPLTSGGPDVPIGVYLLPPIVAGQSVTLTMTASTPTAMQIGAYRLILEADLVGDLQQYTQGGANRTAATPLITVQ